jgi:hypothetical protein
MAVMIGKAFMHASERTINQQEPNNDLPFMDAADISSWASPYVRLATEENLILGIKGSFQPDSHADRAQAAVMISRLLKLLKKNSLL